MAIEIELPELGEGTESADVVKVLVAPGDEIHENQSVLEVESDKASVEVPSPRAGRVAEILVGEGDTISVGQVILTLDGAEAGASARGEAPTPPAQAEDEDEGPPAPTDHQEAAAEDGADRETFFLPNLGEGADEGDVTSVLVQVGDRLTKGQSVIEIESDKASVEVPSEVEGEIVELSVSAGDTVKVGQPILAVAVTGGAGARDAAPDEKAEDQKKTEKEPSRAASEPSAASSREAAPAPTTAREGKARQPVFAAPSVRTKARELGVDLHDVPGSGPAGRISKDDVERFARSGPEPTARPVEAPARPGEAEGRREKMSGVRKTIAQRMTESWQTIPHVTLYADANATALEEIRGRFGKRAQARGAKLTVTALLVKICAAALRRFPNANASVDMESLEVIHHAGVHIGVAADTERGLMVPVLRDAASLGVLDIAVRLSELAEKARAGKLSREEMSGATFSLSNLGGLGVGYFTPIINPPEVAILGVGRAREDGRGRLMMPLSLSIDHRMLDGADGAKVLKWIVDAVEDPLTLIMEG